MEETRKMTLAVILPNYNHGHCIERALAALFLQSRQPDEYLIYDDGSTDNSREVITRATAGRSNVRVVHGGINQGVVYGMNKGLGLVSADWVYFAAADDEVMPGLFERSMAMLEAHPEAGLCCSIVENHAIEMGFKWKVGTRMANEPCYLSPQRLVELALKRDLQISSTSSVFRRQAILDVGGFVTAHAWNSDWFVVHSLAFKHGVCFVPDLLAKFTVTDKSYGSAMRFRRQQRKTVRALLEWIYHEDKHYLREALRQTALLSEIGSVSDVARFGAWEMLTPRFLKERARWFVIKKGRKLCPTWLGQWILNTFKIV